MVVTFLDDFRMGGLEDKWSSYLDSYNVYDAGSGWCVDKQAFKGRRCSLGVRYRPSSSRG